MRGRGAILGIGAILVLMVAWLLMACLAPQGGDLSQVRIGFAGYENLNGTPSLVLIVTNGSAFRITVPGPGREVFGEATNGQTVRLRRKSSEMFYWQTWSSRSGPQLARIPARQTTTRGHRSRRNLSICDTRGGWPVRLACDCPVSDNTSDRPASPYHPGRLAVR